MIIALAFGGLAYGSKTWVDMLIQADEGSAFGVKLLVFAVIASCFPLIVTWNPKDVFTPRWIRARRRRRRVDQQPPLSLPIGLAIRLTLDSTSYTNIAPEWFEPLIIDYRRREVGLRRRIGRYLAGELPGPALKILCPRKPMERRYGLFRPLMTKSFARLPYYRYRNRFNKLA